MRARWDSSQPSMNVRVPAVAPTTPPDIGASTKMPDGCAAATEAATSREDEGSIVEQSMKMRGREGRSVRIDL